MAKPYEQDVFLDVDGKPIFDALRIVQMRIDQFSRTLKDLNQQTVSDVTKIKQIVDANVAALKQARSDLRALQEDRRQREQGFVGVERTAKQRYQAERRAEREARREALTEAKVFYGEEARDRKRRNQEVVAEEVAGERLVMAANKRTADADIANDRARVQSARELRRAKLEAAQAEVISRAKGLTSIDDARAARAASAARLQALRAERTAVASNNAAAARGIAERIAVEKALGAALDTNIRKLETQQRLASGRFASFGARADKLLVPDSVQAAITSTGSRTGALAFFEAEQRAARAHLATLRQQTGVEDSLRRQAIQRLDLLNAQVRAARQLVAEEARAAAAGAPAGPGGPGPLATILSPRYAGIALARTSVYGAAAAAAYGLFNTIQGGLQYVVQFEDELAKLSAIANATPQQMQVLRASIEAIGSETRFANIEIAKIAQTLAQAGVSANSMEDVLRAVTTLATASGSTPDEAVQLVTSALGAFQLQGSEAARVADLMTNALNRTKLTVQQTGQAIQYVGATAFEQNISLEQMLATVGAIAQAGVRSGSTIGTGFRQFLVDLQTPSEKLTRQLEALGLTTDDVNVTVRGLPAVLDTLKNAGFGAAQAYTGLETRAAAFYLTAKNNTDVMDNLILSFAQSNAAAQANERAMGSLAAQWQRLKNILSSEFAEGAAIGLDLLTQAVTALANAIDSRKTTKAKSLGEWLGLPDGWDLSISNESIRDFLNFLDGENNARTRGGPMIGDWLYNLGGAASGAASGMAQLQTVINETSDATEQQRGKLGELQSEYQRLLVQKNSLINNDTRSQAEMVSLMSRFEGLSAHLTNTKNNYIDLTNAVRGYITAQSGVLVGDIADQQAAITNENEALRQQTTNSMRSIRGSAGFSKLTPEERTAFNNLNRFGAGTPEFQRAQIILADAARRLAADTTGIGTSLSRLAGTLGDRSANFGQLRVLGQERALLEGQGTRQGTEVYNQLQAAQALVTQATGASGTNQARLITQANSQLATTIQFLRGFRAQSRYQSYFASALQDAESLQAQLRALQVPTQAEERAAERTAREAEREGRRGPPVTRANVVDIVKGMYPDLAVGSGYRSQAEQDALVRRRVTRARVSDHTTGIGQDFPTGNISQAAGERMAAAVQKRLADQGIEAQVIFENGSGRNQGTGKHIHVGIKPGTRFRTDRSEVSQQGYRSNLAQAQLDLDEDDLAAQLKELAASTTSETFAASLAAARVAVDKVNEDLRTVAEEELAAKGLGPGDPEYAARMRQVEQAVAQNASDFQMSIVEAITKNLDVAFKAAAVATAAALDPTATAQAVADAQVSGLGYASLEGRVPDYVRVLAERRAAQATENSARARAGALPAEMAAASAALERARNEMGTLDRESAAWQKAADAVESYTQKLNDLSREKLALDVALAAGAQIPTTITDGLRAAMDAYRETHELNRSFTDDVIYNMGGALEQVHGGLTTFFTDIFTGSKSALGAFGDFALGIARYMQQLAAQFVANKIFGVILNLLGGAASGSLNLGGAASSAAGLGASASFANAFDGGKMAAGPYAAQGFRWGGKVTNGSPLRDSVRATLAKDEWVINKRAVDSVGDEFMHDLNQRGAAALRGLEPTTAVLGGAKQETNVWVIPPEAKPTMGPNDVLVVMHDDMLNGESRKLVKHISQGG